MLDVTIIGGGAIGLSLAWDLALHGRRVQVIDRGPLGREASWAGAGILSPASREHAIHPYDQLRGLAYELHAEWAAELQQQTGIDVGFRRCGGVHLARTPGEAAALAAWAGVLREEGVRAEALGRDELRELEPALQIEKLAGRALFLPDEAQLRNPRYLQALAAACRQSGVVLSENAAATSVVLGGDRVIELKSSAGPIQAESFCFTAGAWTAELLAQLGVSIGVVPIRGQMVLFKAPQPIVRRIINEGSRYLVPRDDGNLLAGSTEEEAGFDKRTTAEGIAELADFAQSLVPALTDAAIEQTWAGLRPGSLDGFPYLGRVPGVANAFVAAGHFRSGLFLSPATAVVMSQLIRGERPQIDLRPFAVNR